jgi:hypothetical protein
LARPPARNPHSIIHLSGIGQEVSDLRAVGLEDLDQRLVLRSGAEAGDDLVNAVSVKVSCCNVLSVVPFKNLKGMKFYKTGCT